MGRWGELGGSTMQNPLNHLLDNADIERELFQLGLTDTLPNLQRPQLPIPPGQISPQWGIVPLQHVQSSGRKLPLYTRSNSAPAAHPGGLDNTMGSPTPSWDPQIPVSSSHRSLINIPTHTLTPTSLKKHNVHPHGSQTNIKNMQHHLKASTLPNPSIVPIESIKNEEFLLQRAHTLPGPGQYQTHRAKLFRRSSAHEHDSLSVPGHSQLEKLQKAHHGLTRMVTPLPPHTLPSHLSPGHSYQGFPIPTISHQLSGHNISTQIQSQNIGIYDNVNLTASPQLLQGQRDQSHLIQNISDHRILDHSNPDRFQGNVDYSDVNPHLAIHNLHPPQTYISGNTLMRSTIHQAGSSFESDELSPNPRQVHTVQIHTTSNPDLRTYHKIPDPSIEARIANLAFNRDLDAGPSWSGDAGEVHYPGHVQSQDFVTLPRGTQSNETIVLDAVGEAAAAAAERQLIASVEAALRRVHAGLQESHIMYEQPDSELDPPPPQPINQTLRDPPPSPEPPHNHQTTPRPPGPPGPPGPHYDPRDYPPGDSDSGSGRPRGPRLVGPSNASQLSRKVGFIPIQEATDDKIDDPSQHHRHSHHSHRKKGKSQKVSFSKLDKNV